MLSTALYSGLRNGQRHGQKYIDDLPEPSVNTGMNIGHSSLRPGRLRIDILSILFFFQKYATRSHVSNDLISDRQVIGVCV